ncbi:YpmS family protein [Agrilactobacillus fermenti]|uniref:YpmS family protein n=1 Tax=Agrilactobacillus fermenti TaxID=2586909 RepID=UPI001E607D75|nr:YpmS family protein [Agrilactobacillus fermenti]MCD2256550.1 YpmS family protein [Agrilactobacillus fermenti]
MSVKQPRRHNFWMIAFFTLVILLICGGLFVTFKALRPVQPPAREQLIQNNEAFSVTFNKKQMNGFVKYYLNNQLKDQKMKYAFQLDDHATVRSTIEFLGRPVSFSLVCDPYVLTNGDVQLKARSLAVGQLDLPLSFVMGYIAHNFKLPKWVVVNQNKQTINLRLNQFKLENGMQFTAKRIDLKQDKIEFNVFFPNND